MLKGTAPSDQDYDAAVERAAGRFGGKIVEEREYKFDTANPRTDSGHQQIQTQMPEVTQGAPEHDVVWVVDTVEHFGEYVPYRDYDPRPVVGTQGLIAVAWHRSYEQYAGTQMQHRFERFAKRIMTERDYSAWIAVRAIGEAVTQVGQDRRGRHPRLLAVRRVHRRRLQRAGAVVPPLGPSASPADADHRRPLARVDVAAGRLPAPEIPDRHARLRRARDQVQVPKIAKVPEMKRPILDCRRRRAASLWPPPPRFALQIFVSNEKDNTVTVIDGNTLEDGEDHPHRAPPPRHHRKPRRQGGLCRRGDGDIIDVIDTKKLEVVRQLDSGPDPELMAVDPKGGTLYIANEDDSMATVMDTETGR